MNKVEMIEKEIENELRDVLVRNGAKSPSISIKSDSKKKQFRAGGVGPSQRLSQLPLHEVTLCRIGIDIRFGIDEKEI